MNITIMLGIITIVIIYYLDYDIMMYNNNDIDNIDIVQCYDV